MGTPLPPNESGNRCDSCWGLGKEFGDTTTPRVVEATLISIEPGELWVASDDQQLLTPHSLIQTAHSCSWLIDDGTFIWSLNYNVQFTSFEVKRKSDNKEVFVDPLGDPCHVVVPNGHTDPAGVIAFNGYVVLDWDLGGL